MVRSKFVCVNIELPEAPDGGTRVTLQPVTSGSEVNESFFNSTPNGHIELLIKNDVAAEQFEGGKEYYVDFSLADEEV